ncbi:n-glycosylation eos1 [Trichoderma arundinaceum]|uniref:N-glycosylation eos1 n=1 Tax=Trichoderma arundinaceum TaxID=490622 RepID=A0A395P0L3_TRIAR|nr:n-glycosylation eos1 [Trichoderma arundinaceum]
MATAAAPPRYEASPTAHSVAPPPNAPAPAPSSSPSTSSAIAPPPPLRQRLSSSSLSVEKPADSADVNSSSSADRPGGTDTPPVPSMLQPRVAVVLNVPQPWHPWLFALRLCSVLPALWWGLPSMLRLLLHFLPGPPDQFLLVRPAGICGSNGGPLQTSPSSSCTGEHGEAAAVMVAPYAVTETALATIWCFACGYLAFFFTDCLMSRWLINYTPQATIVRLLSINAVNAYLTLSVLSLTGGFQDPRLLLPGWVSIATINIRKETSTSVNVFSIASYITMVVLLAHMQWYQTDYPTMPIATTGNRLWQEGQRLVAQVKTLIHEHAEL